MSPSNRMSFIGKFKSSFIFRIESLVHPPYVSIINNNINERINVRMCSFRK